MNVRKQVGQFSGALVTKSNLYGLVLSPETIDLLVVYYEMLLRWNERLHLVAPCSAEVFASRHVLESLLLLSHLPRGATVADVGSGAGLPIIPCLIDRDDLQATLIESSPKKTVFLREALKVVGRAKAATIIARPFEEVAGPSASFVTCRALDEFLDKLELLIKWAPLHSTLLLFGGSSLGSQLTMIQASFKEELIPNSDRRFLYVVNKAHTY